MSHAQRALVLVHDRPLVHRSDGFRGGWFPAQGAVRPDGVVVVAPFLNNDPERAP